MHIALTDLMPWIPTLQHAQAGMAINTGMMRTRCCWQAASACRAPGLGGGPGWGRASAAPGSPAQHPAACNRYFVVLTLENSRLAAQLLVSRRIAGLWCKDKCAGQEVDGGFLLALQHDGTFIDCVRRCASMLSHNDNFLSAAVFFCSIAKPT